ncbi:methionyl-tRNA formyltransferase [Ramlibacter sp. XY19]|uniref:methionyl-tRNA formyltransferase n=1 Tax=Ramlibacter paludis TaxID=2908000 RepID=UPI0023DC8E72|nr:methionyl-tRNA formyltransferase [Ramlibacter paludis]MCG2594798.1 methionyl-tRNA formyltransferase [Ramlibacter paludis]
MRVVFAGTPEFARVALERLQAAGFTIPLVLTQPDRPAGRGMKLQPSPVKQFAQAHGIAVAQPRSLRLDGKYPDDAATAREALQQAQADVMVVAAYGLILPQWVLDTPRLGCLNIHASLLPRWRGAAPIHRAIEAGDAETGVTIMQMDAGLDTGDMLLEERIPIAPADTTASLHDKLAILGGRMIVEALELAACGGFRPRKQPEQGITYAHKIEKSEAAIAWSQPADAIARRIRAFDPFPGASAQVGGETVKIWAARARPQGGGQPGTIVAVQPDAIVVGCGEGSLEVTELQRPGGKRLAAADFLRGFPLQPGQQFA